MIKWPLESTRISTSNCPSLAGSTIDPPLTCLTEQEQNKLVALAERFAAKTACSFTGLWAEFVKSCRIALLFCLPVLQLGLEWLDGFHEILFDPSPFVVDDEWEDDIGRCITNVLFGQVRAGSRAYRFELVGYTRFF